MEILEQLLGHAGQHTKLAAARESIHALLENVSFQQNQKSFLLVEICTKFLKSQVGGQLLKKSFCLIVMTRKLRKTAPTDLSIG